MSAHYHTCEDCDEWFPCDELPIDSETREGCTVEPPRCPTCEEARQYQRSGEPDLQAAGAEERISRGYDAMNRTRR